jgi:site-specific recombinase XerC
VGRRDFAILMLLSRLGLRACEVVPLALDDVDWRAGELTVHGKGAQTDRLPLPHDVGQALVEHLLGRTPDSGFLEMFLRVFAPHGPLSAKAIGAVLHDACDRAGVAGVGTHRLRHTVATELLAAVSTLLDWYATDTTNVQARLPSLSTYLGARGADEHLLPDRGTRAARARGQTTRTRPERTLMTTLAPTLEAYFTDRLLCQRRVSPNTVASYRDAFRLLLDFAQRKTATPPSKLELTQLDAPTIGAFLEHLEHERGNSPGPGTSASPRSTRSFNTARCATPSTPR